MCHAYTGVEVHPCRVCCKVFHELCLKKKGKLYDQSELDAFRKANTETGWSCHDCVSTIVLLMYCITIIIQSNPINNCLLAWNERTKPRGGGGNTPYSKSDKNDRMGAEIKTQKKSLGLQTKNPWTKFNSPKNPMPNFRTTKISRGTMQPGYTGTITNFQIEYPKKSLLK